MLIATDINISFFQTALPIIPDIALPHLGSHNITTLDEHNHLSHLVTSVARKFIVPGSLCYRVSLLTHLDTTVIQVAITKVEFDAPRPLFR